MGSMVWFIYSASFVLYSAWTGVKILHVVLSGLRMRLFVLPMYVFHVDMIKCLLLQCFCRCVLMVWLYNLHIV